MPSAIQPIRREAAEPRALQHAPDELTQTRLVRIGEGIGKVVYASRHWVVKRERSPSEVVALIALWRTLRTTERILPRRLGRNLLEKPSRQLRFLRVVVQATMTVLPRAMWFTTNIRSVWRQYHFRSLRGERLARERLGGSSLIPEEVTFPPVRVQVGGWPGSLMVSAATERVEITLHQRLTNLANEGRFEELESWLERFLNARKAGWSRGLFSLDAHLKNYGIVQDRIVLLDAGGLTNRWKDVEERLVVEESLAEPHVQLGMGDLLASRPDIAARFNDQWKAVLNRKVMGDFWQGAEN